MSGLVKVRVHDAVYEAVDANLAAGTLVIPSATATESGLPGIAAAGATALNCIGVAAKDCVTAANRAALESGTTAAPMSAPFVDASIPTATTTVYDEGWFKLQYATGTAVARGDRVKCAAGGLVTKWVSGTDSAAAIIGRCAEAVGTGGGTALTRIDV